MEQRVHIYVEGDHDTDFFSYVIPRLFPALADPKALIIEALGGYQAIRLKAPDFERFRQSGITALFIADADSDPAARHREIASLLPDGPARPPLFLVPGDSQPGTLETYIRALATHAGFIPCWDAYVQCMHSLDTAKQVPDQKAFVYAYLQTALGGDLHAKRKGATRRNPFNYPTAFERGVLSLDLEGRAAILRPLLQFLHTHLPEDLRYPASFL